MSNHHRYDITELDAIAALIAVPYFVAMCWFGVKMALILEPLAITFGAVIAGLSVVGLWGALTGRLI